MVEKDTIETSAREKKQERDEKIDNAKEKVNKTVDEGQEKINKIMDETKEKLDETMDKSKEKTNETIGKGKERLNKRMDESKTVADKVGNDLSNAMDDFFTNVKSAQGKINDIIEERKKASVNSLLVDLIEDEEKYYIKVAVPGIDKENVNIKSNESEMDIEVDFTPFADELEDIGEATTLVEELPNGHCIKTIKFANKIDIEDIDAKFKNGTVLITVPKIIDKKQKVDVE